MAAEVGTGSVLQTRTPYRILHYSVIADSNMARLMATPLKKWEGFLTFGILIKSESLVAGLTTTGHITGAAPYLQNQAIF